jgi:hypothetical protein
MGAPEDMTPGERLEWAQACAQRADRAVVAEEKLSEVDLEEVAVEDVKDVYVDVKDLAKDVEDVKVEKAEEVNVAEEVLESKVPEIQSKPKAKEETKTDVVAEQSL